MYFHPGGQQQVGLVPCCLLGVKRPLHDDVLVRNLAFEIGSRPGPCMALKVVCGSNTVR